MGAHLGTVTGVILVIIGVALSAHISKHTVKIGKRRISRRQNLIECIDEFIVATQDVDVANRLLNASGEMMWTDKCMRLAQHGQNPALRFLLAVTDESQAKDMFLTAKTKLEEVLAKAELNLELARSLFPTNDDDES